MKVLILFLIVVLVAQFSTGSPCGFGGGGGSNGGGGGGGGAGCSGGTHISGITSDKDIYIHAPHYGRHRGKK